MVIVISAPPYPPSGRHDTVLERQAGQAPRDLRVRGRSHRLDKEGEAL